MRTPEAMRDAITALVVSMGGKANVVGPLVARLPLPEEDTDGAVQAAARAVFDSLTAGEMQEGHPAAEARYLRDLKHRMTQQREAEAAAKRDREQRLDAAGEFEPEWVRRSRTIRAN